MPHRLPGGTPFVETGPSRAGPGAPPPPAAPPRETADRGRGWYYGIFPPNQVEFFHLSFWNTSPSNSAGAINQLVAAGVQPFGAPVGQVYLVTDWQFHATRADPSELGVPLTRFDVTRYVTFRFLVDGIPIRIFIRTFVGTTEFRGFPFLDTRPGPQLQGAGFGMLVPVYDNQRVTAEMEVVASVPFSIDEAGFEFSGLRMGRNDYERVMARLGEP